jgi:hypothetical protein
MSCLRRSATYEQRSGILIATAPLPQTIWRPHLSTLIRDGPEIRHSCGFDHKVAFEFFR